MEMRAKARRLRSRQQELGLIVVDYLQLMHTAAKAERRDLELAEISRGLKLLARDLDVPVLALSQLSRNVEQRADKRPVLADLRESGAIEADADVVVFLYRDEVYYPDSADRSIAELIVGKHRSGPIGTARVAFLHGQASFARLAKA
jgi:replicative DNA helicase